MSESESESTLSLDEVEINSKRGKNVKGIKKRRYHDSGTRNEAKKAKGKLVNGNKNKIKADSCGDHRKKNHKKRTKGKVAKPTKRRGAAVRKKKQYVDCSHFERVVSELLQRIEYLECAPHVSVHNKLPNTVTFPPPPADSTAPAREKTPIENIFGFIKFRP